MSDTRPTDLVDEAAAERFRHDGWTVLPGVIDTPDLEALRTACAEMVAVKEREMDEAGTDTIDLSHRGRRYFVDTCVQRNAAVAAWALGPRMAAVVEALVGPTAYLFNDQFVVKCGGVPVTTTTSFSWHQDSAYIPYEHQPYLTVWCALDDVTEDNGTVHLLTYDEVGTKGVVPHRRDGASNDLVADPGGLAGTPATLGAGSLACFSSTLLHRSGPNTTARDRRVYVAQYSAAPLRSPDGTSLWVHAIPLLEGGRLVADPAHPADVTP